MTKLRKLFRKVQKFSRAIGRKLRGQKSVGRPKGSRSRVCTTETKDIVNNMETKIPVH